MEVALRNRRMRAQWTADGRFLAVLEGHRAAVTSAVFSPDQRRLLTTSMDGTTRLWVIYPDEDAAVAAAEAHVGRSMMEAECRRYPYLDACPVGP
jgi:WD40 repeat protein